MFEVGQRVVLVGWREDKVRKWKSVYPSVQYPNVGDVYTVREIRPCKDSAVLLLQEISNTHLGRGLEPGFGQEYFRPTIQPKSKQRVHQPEKIDA